MKTRFLYIRNLPFAVAFFVGWGWHTHALAITSYFIDLNTRTVTSLGIIDEYEHHDNGVLGDAISDGGQVAGRSNPVTRGGQAFITEPGGVGARELGVLGGDESYADGINAAGQVVGGSGGSAFITGPNGIGMRGLGTLGGSYSTAADINPAGQVVGTSYLADDDSGNRRAFITGPDGEGMRNLGTLNGGSSYAYGVNDAGQVVGQSDGHAFITGPDGVGMRNLGTLGDMYIGSSASGINDAGQVVGDAYTADNLMRAFVTGPDGVGMRDLGTLGGNESSAMGINNAGQVVGYSYTKEGLQRAFITGPDGVNMQDLNSLVDLPPGITLHWAADINNIGQLVAITIPEPESYALLLAGLALIRVVVRRKNRKVAPLPA